MLGAEAREFRHLLKIRRSRNVCALFRRLESSPSWEPCGGGWKVIDTTIRLDGWSRSRRCLLVRRPSPLKPAPAPKKRGRPRNVPSASVQLEFEFVEDRKERSLDTFALVTNDPELCPSALI